MITQDAVSARRAMENYSNADNTFPSTREAKFLSAITDAFDAGDSETFVGAIQEFDRLTKLVSLSSRSLSLRSTPFLDFDFRSLFRRPKSR